MWLVLLPLMKIIARFHRDNVRLHNFSGTTKPSTVYPFSIVILLLTTVTESLEMLEENDGAVITANQKESSSLIYSTLEESEEFGTIASQEESTSTIYPTTMTIETTSAIISSSRKNYEKTNGAPTSSWTVPDRRVQLLNGDEERMPVIIVFIIAVMLVLCVASMFAYGFAFFRRNNSKIYSEPKRRRVITTSKKLKPKSKETQIAKPSKEDLKQNGQPAKHTTSQEEIKISSSSAENVNVVFDKTQTGTIVETPIQRMEKEATEGIKEETFRENSRILGLLEESETETRGNSREIIK
ncbi:hypothetical protein RB195_020923 [Necator americanus]|uniref:Uncharacterized protein n=1 Tax=Necator americanus TaxID=51031 RepID=A0ABR1CN71_NECAM